MYPSISLWESEFMQPEMLSQSTQHSQPSQLPSVRTCPHEAMANALNIMGSKFKGGCPQRIPLPSEICVEKG